MPPKPPPPARDPKAEALRADGTLNRRADQVTDPVFRAHDFFDARDAVQVKYEMLRRVEIEAQAVAPTAAAFHLSRPSFYQAQRAFQQRGLAGLLPQKRGPHGGHKITGEVLAFLQQARAQDGAVRPAELARRVATRFGLTVHPRSVERALMREKKKRQR
jgi:transposase